MLTECMVESKLPLSELAEPVKMYPQTVRNVTVKNKSAVTSDEQVRQLVDDIRKSLGKSGRILLRESGTEPVVRVMVESTSQKTCEQYAEKVVALINSLGYAWK